MGRDGVDLALTLVFDPRQYVTLIRIRQNRRYQGYDLPLLARIAAGGGWPEGMIYDWIANTPRVLMIEGWRSATGQTLARPRWISSARMRSS